VITALADMFQRLSFFGSLFFVTLITLPHILP